MAIAAIKKRAIRNEQQERYKLLLKDLTAESEAWIGPNEIDKRITPELFGDLPMTTGLETPYSNDWKMHLLTYDYHRPVNPEWIARLAPQFGDEENMRKLEADWKQEDKDLMENFLTGFATTGEQRKMIRGMVEEFSDRPPREDETPTMFELDEVRHIVSISFYI